MIKRKLFPALKKELASDKTIVLTGMRRVGKTTLVKLLQSTVHNKRTLYLDLENPLNQAYFAEHDYDKVKLTLDTLASGRHTDLIVFLDEIQSVPRIPSTVKYLSDHYGIKFVLTGSASFYLKNLFSESLAGRKRLFELYPLDFEEFLSYKAPQITKPGITDQVSQPVQKRLQTIFHEYRIYGGFPDVVIKTTHEEKIAELNDIYTSYFQKEIQLLSDFRKLNRMQALITLLLERVGNKLDVSKISRELGVSRIMINEYVDFLQATYFLSPVNRYSSNADVVIRSQPKTYVCDSGFLQFTSVSSGASLEQSVFGLLRHKGTVSYYHSKAGAEIDFIVTSKEGVFGFEVKSHAHAHDVRTLHNRAQKLNLTNCYIVSEVWSPDKHILYPFQL